MGLGPIRLKSLPKAREEARELAIKITNGIDPIQERKIIYRKSSLPFSEAAARYIQAMQPGWKTPSIPNNGIIRLTSIASQ